MKGKIVDYNSSEAFVALEDDSIVILPLTEVNEALSVGSFVNINVNNISFNPSNKNKIVQDKLVDFFNII